MNSIANPFLIQAQGLLPSYGDTRLHGLSRRPLHHGGLHSAGTSRLAHSFYKRHFIENVLGTRHRSGALANVRHMARGDSAHPCQRRYTCAREHHSVLQAETRLREQPWRFQRRKSPSKGAPAVHLAPVIRSSTLGYAGLPGECWIPVPLPPPASPLYLLAKSAFQKIADITVG
jgi:hypothetical protein